MAAILSWPQCVKKPICITTFMNINDRYTYTLNQTFSTKMMKHFTTACNDDQVNLNIFWRMHNGWTKQWLCNITCEKNVGIHFCDSRNLHIHPNSPVVHFKLIKVERKRLESTGIKRFKSFKLFYTQPVIFPKLTYVSTFPGFLDISSIPMLITWMIPRHGWWTSSWPSNWSKNVMSLLQGKSSPRLIWLQGLVGTRCSQICHILSVKLLNQHGAKWQLWMVYFNSHSLSITARKQSIFMMAIIIFSRMTITKENIMRFIQEFMTILLMRISYQFRATSS